MELTYLGHACFKVTAFDGTSVLMDPYVPGGDIRHRPIPDIVTAVVTSHAHSGHSGLSHLQGRPLNPQDSDWVGTIELTAIPTFHDARGGRRHGPNTVWRLVVDGVSIVHLGDIGHMPTPEQLVEMVPVDVLLCPVGGRHSLDHEQATTIVGLINPRVVVPMHYWTPLVRRRLGRIERFLQGRPGVVAFDGSTLSIDSGALPHDMATWVLRPLY